jgi:hypothetical protein
MRSEGAHEEESQGGSVTKKKRFFFNGETHTTRTIIATSRKSALRLSGSSERPAYPGFMVMNTLQVKRRPISTPSNMKRVLPAASARWMVSTCLG